jgi:hypothetical protein
MTAGTSRGGFQVVVSSFCRTSIRRLAGLYRDESSCIATFLVSCGQGAWLAFPRQDRKCGVWQVLSGFVRLCGAFPGLIEPPMDSAGTPTDPGGPPTGPGGPPTGPGGPPTGPGGPPTGSGMPPTGLGGPPMAENDKSWPFLRQTGLFPMKKGAFSVCRELLSGFRRAWAP